MKIGVNAKFLTKPFTGIGQYTRNLFRELAKSDKGREYILVVPEKIDPAIAKEFPGNVEFKIIPERKIGTQGMKKTWWEQISLPEYFEKEGVDVAFYPYPSNPWTKDWYKKGIKTILCIHDCIPWMRKSYARGFLSKLYHGRSKKAVALADEIFTVSEASKKDIVHVCNVEANKVHVVYNDASEVYKHALGKEDVAEVLKRFSLSRGRFFLYVGGYDERKNVGFLKKEHAVFAKKREDVIPLVLAGGKIFDSKLYGSFDKSGAGNIVKTGFLEEEVLAALYRSCAAFVNVSRHEGFNIPILEAANCGAPLILSDIPVHKEVAGDAALYVDIDVAGKLADAFEKILPEKNQEGFREDSLELARKYSWTFSAQKVKDVLFS
jgi:glycosyltransferase involved in cell wall biosynthesis